MILNTRSEAHLRAVFAAYKQQYGKTVESVIKSEFQGHLERALVALVKSIENRPNFLAERFEKSMHGIGTNDRMLIRLAVRSREPILMNAIKQAYQARFSKSLHARVKGETSGNFEKLLLAIIGQ
jgi:hypothetical protein